MPSRIVVSAVLLVEIVAGGLVLAPAGTDDRPTQTRAGGGPASDGGDAMRMAPGSAPGSAPEDVPEIKESAPRPTLAPGPVVVAASHYWSWALLDRTSNEITGSANLTAQNSTESMIKAWIVADFLRRTEEIGRKPTREQLARASAAIRDSDDNAAHALWAANGGDDVVARLIAMCGLTETTVYPGWWSRTGMSARDAVRMGLCIADGRAAGPIWTPWLLHEMRLVRGGVTDQRPNFGPTGGGRWGIIDGLPKEVAAQVAIKNGWTRVGADNSWHVNCLAIGPDFVLAVQARYPVALGLAYGAGVCRGVTEQLAGSATDG